MFGISFKHHSPFVYSPPALLLKPSIPSSRDDFFFLGGGSARVISTPGILFDQSFSTPQDGDQG